MDPELVSKLSRDSVQWRAQWQQSRQSRSCWRKLCPLPTSGYLDSLNSGCESPGRNEAESFGFLRQAGRVRQPSWVSDPKNSKFDPEKFVPQQPWLRSKERRSKDDACLASPSAIEAELCGRLRVAEKERDAALKEVELAEANANARRRELGDEAYRLRQVAQDLSHELAGIREEAALYGCLLGSVAGSATTASSTASDTRLNSEDRKEVATAEHENLAAELCNHGAEQRIHGIRLSSLSQELERQRVARAELEDELCASLCNEESLRLRLELLRKGGNEDDISTRLGAMMRTPWQDVEERFAVVLAPPQELFVLNDGDTTGGMDTSDLFDNGQNGSVDGSVVGREVSDLEFAYDWGLQLSGHMSVQRALELARRVSAAAASSNDIAQCKGGIKGEEEGSARSSAVLGSAVIVQSDEPESSEAVFEAPLAELQDALAVLQHAEKNHQQEVSFDAALHSLQHALTAIQRSSGKRPAEEEDLAMSTPAVAVAMPPESVKMNEAN